MATVEVRLRQSDLEYSPMLQRFSILLGPNEMEVGWVDVENRCSPDGRQARNHACSITIGLFGAFGTMSGTVNEVAQNLSRLGLDPTPVLEAARELGWEC